MLPETTGRLSLDRIILAFGGIKRNMKNEKVMDFDKVDTFKKLLTTNKNVGNMWGKTTKTYLGDIMELREYLFRNEITVTDFSKKLGYTNSYINQIVNGKAKPSRRLAKLIFQHTYGNVPIDGIYIKERGRSKKKQEINLESEQFTFPEMQNK